MAIKNNIKAKTSKGYEHWVTKHNLQTAASTLVEIRNKGFNSMEELERGISRISIEKKDLKQEFDKLSWEQKRIKEVVKHIQICISKREHYQRDCKNPNDKIYMVMNRKDVEAYQKSYEEIDVFLKQFPHLKKEIMEGLKRGDGKSIFKELNQHSKSLHDIQKGLAEEHDKLQEKRSELEQLKTNIDQYLGRNEEPKKSILQQIKRESDKGREVPSHSRTKDVER